MIDYKNSVGFSIMDWFMGGAPWPFEISSKWVIGFMGCFLMGGFIFLCFLWDRRSLQKRLTSEEEILSFSPLFRHLAQEAPLPSVASFAVNAQGDLIYVSPTFSQWISCERESLLSLPLGRFLENPVGYYHSLQSVHEEVYGHYVDILKTMHHQKYPVIIYQRLQTLSSLEGEKIIEGIIYRQDMSSFKVFENSEFQSFFEEAPFGISVLDSSGHVKLFNAMFVSKLGLESLSLKGRPFLGLLGEGAFSSCQDQVQSLFQNAQGCVRFEVTLPQKGTFSFYLSSLIREGYPSSILVYLLDITEQKKLELQFVQSQKMQAVGQLAGGIAHDFNNLLTAMMGFCDFLLLRHTPGDPSFSDIMQIKQNTNRAANLVRQLLAFSRQQTLQPQVLNITDILAELTALLRRLLGVGIDLKIRHARELGMVLVDQGQLEQVMINLAVNARDAMPQGGSLLIETKNITVPEENLKPSEDTIPPGEYVCIIMTDTGIGIPEENLTRIFEPFFSTKEIGSGTGLGLSTVYGIVKQTGGFVSVRSTVGQGSEFSIFLPRHGAQEEEGSAALKDTSSFATEGITDLTGHHRILLVEDEDAVRLFSARALREKGYEVREAETGEKALEILQETGPFDLLITDVVMPQMTGPQLVNHIRTHYPSLRIIFISGYAEDTFREQLVTDSHIHFLPKPFNLKDLALKVKKVLEEV